MAIDFMTALGVTQESKTGATSEKAEYMLLIGQEIHDPETDEIRFSSLPQPVGIDTMKKKNVFGTGETQDSILDGNDLLDQLIAIAKKNLEPGETLDLSNFKVRLYRRKTNQESIHKKKTIQIAFSKVN